MNAKQQNTLGTFQQCQAWLAERPDVTGIVPSAATGVTTGGSSIPAQSTAPAATTLTPIGEQVALLNAAVNQATAEAAAFDGLSRTVLGLGSEAITLRRELISNQMVHVATIARTAIPDVVRMTEAFRVPKVSRKNGTLLAAAESMAKAGEEYKSQLVASGLSADFLEELRSAASALRDVIQTRGTTVADRVGATTAFHEAMVRGRKAVDTITVLIKRQFKGDRATVDSWMQLRRIRKVGARTQAGATVPAALAATTPAAQTPVASTAPATASVVAAATAAREESVAA